METTKNAALIGMDLFKQFTAVSVVLSSAYWLLNNLWDSYD